VELEAERIELAMLAAWLGGQAASARATKDAGAVLSRSALYFSGRRGALLADPDVEAALRKLALAADIAGREAPMREYGSPVHFQPSKGQPPASRGRKALSPGIVVTSL
jgi:hypothetical protein